MTPFDYVKSINTKNYIYSSGDGYNQYIINLAFSYYLDTIFYVNELNKYQNISDKEHYDFLYYAIPKRNRWATWNKKQNEDKELIDLVAQIYDVSLERAKETMKIMSNENLEYIKRLQKQE